MLAAHGRQDRTSSHELPFRTALRKWMTATTGSGESPSETEQSMQGGAGASPSDRYVRAQRMPGGAGASPSETEQSMLGGTGASPSDRHMRSNQACRIK